MNKTEQFIENSWEKCVNQNRSDDGTLIGLPYPYTVPAVGRFDEIYYWDTYFTNIGLIICGREELAKNNTDNLLYMADRFGFVPNGNRTYYLTHSQPPFLSEMVSDIYKIYRDRVWLSGAYKALEKEYSFWMTERITETGLNTYDTDEDEEHIIGAVKGYERRTGLAAEGDAYSLGRHFLAVCESGWDVTARWGTEIFNNVPVDLNSLMYGFEKNMGYFSSELGGDDAEKWQKRAEKRLELMNKYLLKDGVFLDYNFEKKEHSKVFSAASAYPLFVKAASKEQAAAFVKELNRIEEKYGISAAEKNDIKGRYQWGYPNGWACLQYIVFAGLDNYGYHEDAVRIAKKYVSLADDVFEKTGNLWEKYNVADGNIEVKTECKEMPAMMGWSAGAYIAARHFLTEE